MEQGVVKLICAKEVADRLGVTPRIAARLMRTNQIRAFKLSGKIWRTTPLYLELFVTQALHERAAALARPRLLSKVS